MTKQELNRDIKALYTKVKASESYPFKEEFEKDAIREFRRLYHADREFVEMNLKSIKMMLKMNLRFRAIAFHQFGLSIEI